MEGALVRELYGDPTAQSRNRVFHFTYATDGNSHSPFALYGGIQETSYLTNYIIFATCNHDNI